MVPYQVKPGRGHKRRKFFQKLQRFQNDVCRPVTPAVPELIHHPAIRQQGEALGRNGRTSDVPAEPLKLPAGPGREAHICVQAHAGCAGASRARRSLDLLELKPAANRADTPAGMRAGGDPSLHRGTIDVGEQRPIAPERICFFRVGLRGEPAALEEPDDTPRNAIRDPGNLLVVRRTQGMKAYARFCVLSVNAVEDEGMKVDVQVQSSAESPHERHGSTLPSPDAPLPASPTAERKGSTVSVRLQNESGEKDA